MYKFAELLSKVTVKDTVDTQQEDFNIEMVRTILRNLPQDRKPQ